MRQRSNVALRGAPLQLRGSPPPGRNARAGAATWQCRIASPSSTGKSHRAWSRLRPTPGTGRGSWSIPRVGSPRIITWSDRPRFWNVVFHDGLRVEASVLAIDARNDLAVLQVHPSHLEGRPVLTLSAEEIYRGDRVAAFGTPLTLDPQVTRGILSWKNPKRSDGRFSHPARKLGRGPVVLERDGAVVGVSTFGIGGDRGRSQIRSCLEALGQN